jgi:hypothetical protein
MTRDGTWVSYAGSARPALALILLVAAAGVAVIGMRVRRPIRPPLAGKYWAALLVAWLVSIALFLVGFSVYVDQVIRDHLAKGVPADPITPVTFAAALAVFTVILVAGPQSPLRLVSAAVGAMAGAMIFEFPFDLIVMARTYPALPPDPALYRAWFFVPLFLVELASLALLTVSPRVQVSRLTFLSFALMLIVFAVWALAGFGYPSAPLPIALNTVSKVLAFGTALTLFLPLRRGADVPAAADLRQQLEQTSRVPVAAWSGVFGGADTPRSDSAHAAGAD